MSESTRVRPDGSLVRCGGAATTLAQRYPDYRNDNPLWESRTRQARLDAARGEVVAAHLLVEAHGAPLHEVQLSTSLPGARVFLERLIHVPSRSTNEEGPLPGVCDPGDYPDPLLPVTPGTKLTVTRLGGVAPAPDNRGAGVVSATGAYTGRGRRSYVVEMTSPTTYRVSRDGGHRYGEPRTVASLVELEDGIRLGFHGPTRKVEQGPGFVTGDHFSFEAYDVFVQGFFLEVQVPRDAPPGPLRGELVVSARGLAPAVIALEVVVRDVTLARQPSLLTVWRFYPDDLAIAHRVEGLSPERRFGVVAAYLRAARAHRAEGLVRWVDPVSDPERFRRTYGTLLSGKAFADGRPPPLFELSVEPPSGDPEAAARWVARLRRAVDEVSRLGYPGQLLVYPIDEPQICDYRRVAEVASLVAQGGGGRVALLLTAHPFPLDPVDSQHGLWTRWRCGPDLATQLRRRRPPPVIWAMPAQYYFPEAGNPGSPHAVDRVRRWGDRAWFYQDHEPWIGGVRLDAELLGPRTWGWAAFRYRPDGVFYYAATHWQSSSYDHRNPAALAHVALTYRGRTSQLNGDGSLFYPGPAFGLEEPVLSLRAKAFRRGSFDHALLTMLHAVRPREAAALAARLVPGALNRFLPGRDRAAPTWRQRPGRGDWSHDATAYDETVSEIRKTLAATGR